ncbi:MAG TPA: NAD(P)-dependent oxidoreductase, partial [Candidatus Gracilibacteria bacterium]|nr:NAD(P)-dependent oxidoreductase [Candidatus Gracilibacteria bacterium]
DFTGITKPLLEQTEIEDKKIIILGAGGLARAIVYACNVYGGKVKILNRTLEKAEQIAKEFNCEFGQLEDYRKEEADIVINATSVGMQTNESLLNAKDFSAQQVVVDLVYRPRITQFLKNATQAGATIVTGDNMLLEQAYEQFKLFTGKNAPREVMQKALIEALSGE